MIPVAPAPDAQAGRHALAAWRREKSILGALSSLHRELGDAIRLSLPGFQAVLLAGAEANRFVLVEQRANLSWRMQGDPVAKLLRNGLLMQDGAAHDQLRAIMSPPLQRQAVARYVETIGQHADEQSARWDEDPRDMLFEMRRLALSVLTETLFGVDVRPQIDQLWQSLLRTLDYISPGLWLVWKGMPQPSYSGARRQLDQFLFELIAAHRKEKRLGQDLIDHLMGASGDDELVRDQLMTMLIAGHDTSTALLAWTLYLLGKHPSAQSRARAEVEAVCRWAAPRAEQLTRLHYLDSIIKESLRLYPPIHLGNRRATQDLVFQDRLIPAGTRVLYSIYLAHRDPRYWSEPSRFDPGRFSPDRACKPPPFAYLPFGGGPRFCIGAAFAQTEAKVILARLLQQFQFELISRPVQVHMGATLEPSPGVWMRARRR